MSYTEIINENIDVTNIMKENQELDEIIDFINYDKSIFTKDFLNITKNELIFGENVLDKVMKIDKNFENKIFEKLKDNIDKIDDNKLLVSKEEIKELIPSRIVELKERISNNRDKISKFLNFYDNTKVNIDMFLKRLKTPETFRMFLIDFMIYSVIFGVPLGVSFILGLITSILLK